MTVGGGAICSPAYALAYALWHRSPAFADADRIAAAAKKAGVVLAHASGATMREESIRDSLDSLGDCLLASGMEAGTVETEGLDPKDDSPTASGGDAKPIGGRTT